MIVYEALQELEKSSPPIQPELYGNFPTYEERLIDWNHVSLKKSALFYQFKTEKNIEKLNINLHPDACINILFNCNHYEKSGIYGLTLHTTKIELEPDTQYFGFKPYSTSGLKIPNLAYQELVNDFISFYEVYPDTSQLCEKLNDSTLLDKRIEILTDYAQDHMIDYDHDLNFVDYYELLLCSTKGNVQIEEIDDLTGYSNRYCRKKFKDRYGVTPKQYSNILRFQSSMKDLLGGEYSNLSELANDNGYFDQSHFIHDFEKYTNTSPKIFRKICNKLPAKAC